MEKRLVNPHFTADGQPECLGAFHFNTTMVIPYTAEDRTEVIEYLLSDKAYDDESIMEEEKECWVEEMEACGYEPIVYKGDLYGFTRDAKKFFSDYEMWQFCMYANEGDYCNAYFDRWWDEYSIDERWEYKTEYWRYLPNWEEVA